MKIFSESHKTVFVVDHCPYMAESCRQHVEFDMLVKNRTQGIIPLAPISKSLWTCSVESSMEYCRIMYDIFPFKKLVNFIVSDSGAHVLNSWTQEDQNLQEFSRIVFPGRLPAVRLDRPSLWNCSVSPEKTCLCAANLAVCLLGATGDAAVGPPNPRADPECCSILHGLVAAVETLCKITEYQHEARTLLMENAERVGNRGRIICITNAKSDSHVRMLEDCVQETIHEHNKLAANSDHLMQIQKCELVLIHTYPVGEDSLVSDRPKKELSPVLTSEVHSVRAGRHLATKLNILVQQHFDLASTTITNIPMKPTFSVFDQVSDNHLGGSSREGSFKETITLKWCTPRTNNIGRIILLLTGRSVLLEQPRKSGSKVISHMLSSHGGEIFLHVLSSSRSILEDPPSISEGCGGRVTDYRITDFGEFMRENRLTPFLDPRYKIDGSLEIPLERAKDQLEKHTRYWPMIISQTTIFNMQAVVPLASVIVKESLTEEDVLNCQKTIYNLVDMERKNDPLPISTVGTRGKGPKRDEQYRIMWNELETLVRAHINNSEKHQRVLECLMACRSKPPEEEERKKRGRKREDKEDKSEKAVKDYEQEKSWQDSERLKGILERGKEELAEAEIIKDSPDSPEPPNKKPLVEMDETPPVEKSKGPVSLLSLWSNRINTANSRKHQEFAGRLNSVNNRAELYQHLKEENGMETTENGKASRQ
ncbi:Integrator complex subunit 13 [Camelus dromedarius]|uniref:Integrator complex subunit 13 n=1 Tax=Camelus dromedarius TaxID=9838 RepID=A0A5N4C679_CAMDR|nr:Integrator complex subunit 13 [Camelus dromedarius]